MDTLTITSAMLVSMGIENVRVLGIENVRVRALPRGGSGATGAGQRAGSRAGLMMRAQGLHRIDSLDDSQGIGGGSRCPQGSDGIDTRGRQLAPAQLGNLAGNRELLTRRQTSERPGTKCTTQSPRLRCWPIQWTDATRGGTTSRRDLCRPTPS